MVAEYQKEYPFVSAKEIEHAINNSTNIDERRTTLWNYNAINEEYKN